MIQVLVRAEDRPVVIEFFELFKTPWEFFRPESEAKVLISAQGVFPKTNATLILIFGDESQPFDAENGVQIISRHQTVLSYREKKIPVYGNCRTFGKKTVSELSDKSTGETAIQKIVTGGQTVIHIGYDLFSEIRFLLTEGQPPEHAQIPVLERHIALIRDLIVNAGIPLVEVPPCPLAHDFIACLTHDVDHVGIRNHKCDHTMFGFLLRATLGSTFDVLRGRKTLRQCGANWSAALSLPLVHLGLVKDFWYQFDHYIEIEKGLCSTFFVVPNKHDPGKDMKGGRPAKRATQYDASDISDELEKLRANGNEIGLHGIDAWRDSVKGRAEMQQVSLAANAAEIGVRMHWLFFDKKAPAVLEAAGFSYDSTIGYNQTVGYRAGTVQVFKPLSVLKMLELPMHVMDTALFYPSYLNLSPLAASRLIDDLMAQSAYYGGVLTVNWHDRSIAPERLWGDFYTAILSDLKAKGAWFATATQTVTWFRNRRAVTFEQVGNVVKIKMPTQSAVGFPALRLRVFKPSKTGQNFTDVPLQDGMEISLTA